MIDENGGGTRSLELVMKQIEGEQITVDADRMPGIYMIGDDERVERRTGEDGAEELVYRTTRRMSGPADWKGVKMDIRIDGAPEGEEEHPAERGPSGPRRLALGNDAGEHKQQCQSDRDGHEDGTQDDEAHIVSTPGSI